MPSWSEVLKEMEALRAGATNEANTVLDTVRRKYLKILFEKTGRNVIAYYSGWLEKGLLKGIDINDDDKNAFMAVIHKLDRSKGLDLILHTPGGEISTTESLVDYLRTMFGIDIRAIVPQIAMSAGTMIACACKEIIMGKPSNLGPIDPQLGGIPTHGVLEEFNRAKEEIKKNPSTIPLWQTIIGKYPPTFIGECEKSIAWSSEIVKKWLETGMFFQSPGNKEKAKEIANALSDHKRMKSHSRHIGMEQCINLGLKIKKMEEMDNDLQDIILTIHHTYIHTFSKSAAIKIVENHNGQALVKLAVPQKPQN